MHNQGYSTMCGHGVIAVVTLAIERGSSYATAGRLVLDAPAGSIHASAQVSRANGRACTGVSFRNVPSFVLLAGVPADWDRVSARTWRLAARSAIVDSEAAASPSSRSVSTICGGPGWPSNTDPVGADHRPSRAAAANSIYGTIFARRPRPTPISGITIFADAEVDRSPCGTGTCAVMAVLSAMGLLAPGRRSPTSIIGTLQGPGRARDGRGRPAAIVPQLAAKRS